MILHEKSADESVANLVRQNAEILFALMALVAQRGRVVIHEEERARVRPSWTLHVHNDPANRVVELWVEEG